MNALGAGSRVLVVGSGGREHALARALTACATVAQVWVAPGNGGIARLAGATPADVAADDHDGLLALARELAIDLVVVGPEGPLVAGLVDRLQAAGVRAFGPTAAAARLEGSKAFAKDFMRRHGIPTPRATAFTDLDAACAHIRLLPYDMVIKASGLAGGKGVVLPESPEAAIEACRAMLVGGVFGEAGREILIEERVRGREISLLAFCDGERLAVMPAARDHKPALDGDRGPNTGGMGAVAPAGMRERDRQLAVERILLPTVAGMRAEGVPFRGVLYAGLMLTERGPMVLEFNVRFGDPECQVLLPLLDSDLLGVLEACATGHLDPAQVRWREGAVAAVVAAADGYPGPYRRGAPIEGIERADAMVDVSVIEAGTALDERGRQVTNGGRVLAVVARGSDVDAAVQRAYKGMDAISFQGLRFRRDIGGRPIPNHMTSMWRGEAAP